MPQGGTFYNDLSDEAPAERGTFFRLQVYEMAGFYSLKYMKGEGNLSFGSVKGPKTANR